MQGRGARQGALLSTSLLLCNHHHHCNLISINCRALAHSFDRLWNTFECLTELWIKCAVHKVIVAVIRQSRGYSSDERHTNCCSLKLFQTSYSCERGAADSNKSPAPEEIIALLISVTGDNELIVLWSAGKGSVRSQRNRRETTAVFTTQVSMSLHRDVRLSVTPITL